MTRRWAEPDARFVAARTRLRVRFQEVDPLQVVWHGHYLAYFEEGRRAFGEAFGLRYQDLFAAGLLAPIVHLSLDYFSPARLDDELEVEARLHPDLAARLDFTYVVRGPEGRRLAAGRTVQAFTDREGRLLLTRPPLLEAFWTRASEALAEGPRAGER